jgi:putative transposase
MLGKKHKPEEIIGKLREVEIMLVQAARPQKRPAYRNQRADLLSLTRGIRWSADGLGSPMKGLEKANLRLRRVISGLMLDKLILEEAARGNF